MQIFDIPEFKERYQDEILDAAAVAAKDFFLNELGSDLTALGDIKMVIYFYNQKTSSKDTTEIELQEMADCVVEKVEKNEAVE